MNGFASADPTLLLMSSGLLVGISRLLPVSALDRDRMPAPLTYGSSPTAAIILSPSLLWAQSAHFDLVLIRFRANRYRVTFDGYQRLCRASWRGLGIAAIALFHRARSARGAEA